LRSEERTCILRPRTHLGIVPQSTSVRFSRGVLLAPRLRFAQNGVHSGERAARYDPPVFAAPGGKMSSLQVASAAFMFVNNILSRRRKRRERCWWQTELYRKRSVYSVTSWLADLKCRGFSGRYKVLLE